MRKMNKQVYNNKMADYKERISMDRDAFLRRFEWMKPFIKNFSERVDEVITLLDWDEYTFTEHTTLSKTTYARIKKHEDHAWQLGTALKIVASLRLDPLIAIELLESAGYKLNASGGKAHMIISYYIAHYKDSPVEEWSEFIKHISVEKDDTVSPDV
jgi:hypothetical protein